MDALSIKAFMGDICSSVEKRRLVYTDQNTFYLGEVDIIKCPQCLVGHDSASMYIRCKNDEIRVTCLLPSNVGKKELLMSHETLFCVQNQLMLKKFRVNYDISIYTLTCTHMKRSGNCCRRTFSEFTDESGYPVNLGGT